MSCKAIENFLGVRNLKLKELKSHKPFVGMMILLGVCILALVTGSARSEFATISL